MLHRWIVAVIVAMGIGVREVRADERPSAPVATLEVLLTVAPGLADASRATLLDEAAAIWREHGVRIEWLPGSASRPVSANRLRVLVIERDGVDADDEEPFTVGRLVRAGSGHPVAFTSIERAERIVEAARARGTAGLAAMNDRLVGLVLGRAVAHEIGHFLLETHTHARHGLMRAQFDVREFADRRGGAFVLDRDAAIWLRTRLERGLALGPADDAAVFAYAR